MLVCIELVWVVASFLTTVQTHKLYEGYKWPFTYCKERFVMLSILCPTSSWSAHSNSTYDRPDDEF